MKKRILHYRMTARALMITLLLGVAGIMKGYTQNFTIGDLNYSVNEDEVSVTVRGHVNGTSASGELSIPETIIYNGDNYSVTGIRNQAFLGCSGLTGSLVIPNSITKIGEYAFKNCTGFNGTLTIGTAVNRIEEEAFANTGFITVNFNPTNCTKMGYYREDGDWYGSPVFKDCPTITTLNIAENVTEIPVCAFRNCSGLDGNLNIPNPVTYIGYGAFYGCSGYTDTLTIGTSVTSISDYAFYGCQFAELHYNAINCTYHYGESPLLFSSNEKTLVIGNTVEKIPAYFFYNSGISGYLTIPNSVTQIGEGAFESCSHLTGELIIPNSVTKIGDGAFHLCSGFTKLTIGTSVSSMGYLAFANCNGITEVHYNAVNCANIFPVYNYWGRKPPFEGCDFELYIGEGVTKIPSNMFRDQNYGGILSGSITIPNSVTTIGDYAFAGNSRVTSITAQRGTPLSVGTNAFSAIDTSIPCYVPYGTTASYMSALGWNEFTNYHEMAYRTISGYGESDGLWQFIASPLVDNISPETVDNMMSETDYDLYQFNPTETEGQWQNFKADTFNLVNGQGYLYANEEEVNIIFKGEFNEDDTKEVELIYDEDNPNVGWNLVGNPFPVSAYINRDYYVMNEDGTGINPVAVPASTPIPPCTGVMVRANGAGETVVFSKTAP